jgi:hypothetical protein
MVTQTHSQAEPPPHDLAQYASVPGGWRKRRWCSRCKAFKPQRAHHDSVTGRCIVKLDHYCPWVNNAVGVFNHKFFLLFVLYTCLQCGYSLSLVLGRFVDCAHADARRQEERWANNGRAARGVSTLSSNSASASAVRRQSATARRHNHHHRSTPSRKRQGLHERRRRLLREAKQRGVEAGGAEAVAADSVLLREDPALAKELADLDALQQQLRMWSRTSLARQANHHASTSADHEKHQRLVDSEEKEEEEEEEHPMARRQLFGVLFGDEAEEGEEDAEARRRWGHEVGFFEEGHHQQQEGGGQWTWQEHQARALAAASDVEQEQREQREQREGEGGRVGLRGGTAAAEAKQRVEVAAEEEEEEENVADPFGLGEDGCGGLGLLTAMVVMEAILFGLFTLCMLCDQVRE